MKKAFAFLIPVLALSHAASSQKTDGEILRYERTHIPGRLIYDQIKNYGVSVVVNNNSLFTIDTYANNFPLALTSYDKVDYANAQLKVQVVYGPCIAVDEKTVTETREEKVDSVKKKVTYYKRVFNFRYPISCRLVNSGNNTTLYTNSYSESNVRTIETGMLKSEAEAIKNLAENRNYYLTSNINGLCKDFILPCNDAIRDMFDFYPEKIALDIFRIRKWDKSDEYNDHIKNIMDVFKAQREAEQPAVVKEKIKNDLSYLQSFEGVFKPTDKKEDVLYFSNYFNLSTIYFALDDYGQAKYYLQKLDSCEKKERLTSYLKSAIEAGEARAALHFLSTTHLDYNPVKDYRLAGKNIKSNAGELPVAAPSAAPIATAVSTPKIYSQLGQEKNVLKAIWLAYQCWNAGNTSYLEPADYIYQGGNLVVGQKFLYPVGNEKYTIIRLNSDNTQIPSAIFSTSPNNNNKVELIWTGDKLIGIKIKSYSGFDYTIDRVANGDIIGFTARELWNNKIQTVFRMEYKEDRIEKITKFENDVNTKKPWIRSIETFAYSDTAVVVDRLAYPTGKPNKPENASGMQCIYKRSKGNPYIVVQPYGETTEISYNSNDDVEKKIIRKKIGTVEEHIFTYTDGKLFKEETTIRNTQGDFIERNVNISFTLNGLSASVPDHEKLEGNYKFTQTGELIWEARDGKYRQKTNGVWSDWAYFKY